MKRKRTKREIEHLLPKIRKLLEGIYGDRLVDIILYGSFAGNKATMESDIDIAIVLKGQVDKAKEIDQVYDKLYDLMLETGELISVYPLSEDEIESSNWPLYYYIRTEGIKI
ncbi:MAG: nucleotidyltransferase domain-containing protein [Candidatus Lokiarchaeia archaeon]